MANEATHVHQNRGPVKVVPREDPLCQEGETWVKLLEEDGQEVRVSTHLLEPVAEENEGAHPWLEGRDTRPKLGAWAPGKYFNECSDCEENFIGDKRAQVCADCAYGPTGETYEIETLEDMLAIPDHRIDAFMKDLRSFLEVGVKVMHLISAIQDHVTDKADAMKRAGWDGTLMWQDDGQHVQTMHLEGPEGETLAALDIEVEE